LNIGDPTVCIDAIALTPQRLRKTKRKEERKSGKGQREKTEEERAPSRFVPGDKNIS